MQFIAFNPVYLSHRGLVTILLELETRSRPAWEGRGHVAAGVGFLAHFPDCRICQVEQGKEQRAHPGTAEIENSIPCGVLLREVFEHADIVCL